MVTKTNPLEIPVVTETDWLGT